MASSSTSSSASKRPRLRLELPSVASCSSLGVGGSRNVKKQSNSRSGGPSLSRQHSDQPPGASAASAGRLWLCPDDDLGRQAADSAAEDRRQMWTDRYSPESRDELCLHKRKLEELEACLRSRPRLLLIHGPCGAGKSAAVRVLCQQLNMRPAYLSEELDACAGVGSTEALQALVRLARFGQAGVIVWDEPTLTPTFGENQQGQFGSSASEALVLRSVLDQFLARCRDVSLVLITCNERLVSRDWLEDNGAVILQVNPVARTQLVRCLNAILTRRRLRPASYKSLIESVATAADGDIRAAVSGLQFSLQFALTTTGSSSGGVLFRDTPYQLFHAVGKLLHAKRADTATREAAPPLLEEPETVSERCSLPVDLLLSFVQTNAAVHFSQDAIEPLAMLSDAFSLSDRLSAAWNTESDAKPQAISLASRALVYHLFGPNRAPNQFRPIRKPPKLSAAAFAGTASAARAGIDAFYAPACLRHRLAKSASSAAASTAAGGARFVICPEPDLQLEATIVDDDWD